MVFALGAGKLFKLDNGGEFEETIIGEFVFLQLLRCKQQDSDYFPSPFQRNASTRSSPSRQPSDPPRVISRRI